MSIVWAPHQSVTDSDVFIEIYIEYAFIALNGSRVLSGAAQ